MRELIQRVMDESGISEDAATRAVNAVIGYLKQRAPAPIASQIDQYVSDDAGASVVGAAKGALGGMFGQGKKEEG